MNTNYHHVFNGAGWIMVLKQSHDPERHNPELKPIGIIPGYGMSAYIFSYHPWDVSMEEYLVKQGFEVWSINFRNQGDSRCNGGCIEYTIEDIVYNDLKVAVDHILEMTKSQRDKVDLIGGSLGGAYAYLYAALINPDKVGALVGIGAPFKMVNVHPAFVMVTYWPKLLKQVKLNHTRQLARLALPLVLRMPRLISIYLHPEIVDTKDPESLLKAIENPNCLLNYQLAYWVKNEELFIEGKSFTSLMQKVSNPILCVLSNADGIVSRENALAVLDAASSEVKDYFVAGDENIKMAHADLFVSDYCKQMVFEPMTNWLLQQN